MHREIIIEDAVLHFWAAAVGGDFAENATASLRDVLLEKAVCCSRVAADAAAVKFRIVVSQYTVFHGRASMDCTSAGGIAAGEHNVFNDGLFAAKNSDPALAVDDGDGIPVFIDLASKRHLLVMRVKGFSWVVASGGDLDHPAVNCRINRGLDVGLITCSISADSDDVTASRVGHGDAGEQTKEDEKSGH